MRSDLDALFAALQKSRFRSKFRLGARDQKYFESRGMTVILMHAKDFIAERLAPANPRKDGKQTPWRGHPVFVAQHATGTCCRGCLEKWHSIPKGRELTTDERRYVVRVIERWLCERERKEPRA